MIYKSGKKWHSRTFIAFFKSTQKKINVAFVTSKKVGNAVKRNDARRRLRALFLEFETSLKNGDYIFIAKEEIHQKDYLALKKDFKWTMQKLNLYHF